MTIAEYQALTGKTVSDADTPRVKAVIRRAEAKLGGLLGYSLSKQKQWTELGRTHVGDYSHHLSLPVGDNILNSLRAPDDQTGDIQLFSFDPLDTHIRINPAREVYRAKLVLPVNEDEFITVYDLDNVSPYLNDAGLVVAISRYYSWFTWAWWDSLSMFDRSHLMIAVDAKYVNVCDANRFPDLAYLLTDMIDYYSDPLYSVMGNIRSESIDSHSYSRASTGATPDQAAPEGQSSSRKIIEKYAGPGAFRKLVR